MAEPCTRSEKIKQTQGVRRMFQNIFVAACRQGQQVYKIPKETIVKLKEKRRSMSTGQRPQL